MPPLADGTAYFNALKGTVEKLTKTLTGDGINRSYLTFGGPGPVPKKEPRVPTDARSEFLANRAMGDWAEKSLTIAIRNAFPKWQVVQYGNTDQIAAGHPKFKSRFLSGLNETRLYGKRPDLLLFETDKKVPADMSSLEHAIVDPLVGQAIGAIEVRSSKFEALTYMRVRQYQRAAGNKAARETPSFTVKVEDLKIVYRWLEKYQLPQIYVQVFFDSIFAINFLTIFEIIADGEDYTIETPAKSQLKSTIMIPITCGQQVGRGLEMPSFAAEHRVTELGRHDVYVVPKGGAFEVDPSRLLRVFGQTTKPQK